MTWAMNNEAYGVSYGAGEAEYMRGDSWSRSARLPPDVARSHAYRCRN